MEQRRSSDFLKINEAARLLGVNPRTVYRHVWAGKIPAAKVGGLYLIRRADLEALLGSGRLGGPLEEESSAVVMKCGSCYRILLAEGQVGQVCEAEGCQEIVCAACVGEGKLTCAQHEPAPGDRLQAALQALGRGDLTVVVRSNEARLREINFISRIQARLFGIATLIHPMSGEAITVKDWDACVEQGDERADVMRQLRRVMLDAATLEQSPLNAWFRARPPLAKSSRAVPLEIDVRVLSRIDVMTRDGFDTRAMGVDELTRQLNQLRIALQQAGTCRLALFASSTGWDPAARQVIEGLPAQKGALAFAQRGAIVYLFDLDKGELIYNQQDDQARQYAELFVPQLRSEEITEATRAVEKAMLLYDSLTLEHASMTLPYSTELINQVFQRLGSGGEYSLMDIPRLGLALIRN